MPHPRKMPSYDFMTGSCIDPVKELFYKTVWPVFFVILLLMSHPLHAQTISEYSRSQRSVIEAEMARNTARALSASAREHAAPRAAGSPGEPPPTFVPPLPAGFDGGPATAPAALSPGIPAARQRPLSPQPTMGARALPTRALKVAGVFISAQKTLAQITIDGQDHLLSLGQEIPGTTWQVQAISAHQVVLERTPRKGPRTTRVFKLPSA
jgi:hypothetical protein